MTKTQEAALQELGLDENELAEKTARAEALARGEQKLALIAAAMLGEAQLRDKQVGTMYDTGGAFNLDTIASQKPPRKKRSDAGKPKPKAPAVAQKPGVLDSVQVARLRDLIQAQETCRIELESAEAGVEFRQGRLDTAQAELEAYLNELQGVK